MSRTNVISLAMTVLALSGSGALTAALVQQEEEALLLGAASEGRVDLVKTLLDEGADVDVRDKDDWTPLIFAAAGGHAKVVNLLLKRGADLKAKDKDGWTPLMVAAAGGRTKVVNLLLTHGADVSAKDMEGWSALMFAAQNDHTEVANLLVEGGADVDAADKEGVTALMVAGYGGRTEVVSLLLDGGADVGAKDAEGWTPLMFAGQEGHSEVVNLLLEHGADASAKDVEGWSALMFAAQNGHTEVVNLLLEGGADVSAVAENGATALALAAGSGHSRIVELLGETGAVPVPPAQASGDGEPAPFRGTGFLGLVILLVCVTQRKKEIGGWLLYYYIQIYLATFVTLVMAAVGFEDYLPATWAGASGLYVLFLLSTVPGVLLVPAQVVAAERLRLSRRYDRLGTLRLILWLELAAAILALAIDSLFFTESLGFSVLALLWPMIWLPYFYRSKRVDRVFRTRDWLPVLHPEPAG